MKVPEALNSHRTGILFSINVSNGGVPKKPVAGAKVSLSGLAGDAYNDIIGHGGPERAVCIYSVERIRGLRQEGHPIEPGTAGENLTIEGIDWELVAPGARFRVGDNVVLEVASFTSPCKTIRNSFIDGKFVRIAHKVHPGWSRVYARVISEGEIRSGDPIELIPPPQ
jgi:MOSC domain-containing protein YiiM